MPRVLVVEDDKPIADLVVEALEELGLETDVARNGAEALTHLAANLPDVIVLDLMMPVMHGWEFVERYREATGGEIIPIVVISAAGAVTRSMYELGVRAFLAKPFNLEELIGTVATVMGSETREADR
jgi:two-component system chemotaxis response regulator CheY